MSKTVNIKNPEGMFHRNIGSAKPKLLAREFILNAVQNGVKGVPVKVEFLTIVDNNVPKLVVRDNASGMDRATFEDFDANVGASYGTKATAGTAPGNFGIGARLSGLRSHPHGIEYFTRSVKDGPVLTTRFRDNGKAILSDGVTEASDNDANLLLPNGMQGTAVVFHGRFDKHNSVMEAFAGAQDKVSLLRSIIERMYRLPKGVTVSLVKDGTPSSEWLHGGDGTRSVLTMEGFVTMRVANRQAKAKVVTLPNGIKIHYTLFNEVADTEVDKRQMMAGVGFLGNGGVIWENELYHHCTGHTWATIAKVFGIDTVAHRCWVFVELPDQFPMANVANDRAYLEWKFKPHNNMADGYGGRTDIYVRNFAPLIIANLPDFIKDEVESNRKKRDKDEVEQSHKDFADMMKAMSAMAIALVKDKNGTENGGEDDDDDGPNPGPEKRRKPSVNKRKRVQPDPNNPNKAKEKFLVPQRLEVEFREFCKDEDGVDNPAQFVVASGGKATMYMSESFPLMKRIKAQCKLLLATLSADEFEKWWDRSASMAARATYGLHYAGAYVYSRLGREDDMLDLFEWPSSLACVSHHYSFVERMRKSSAAKLKSITATTDDAAEAA